MTEKAAQLIAALGKRRTMYSLGKRLPVTEAERTTIVKSCVRQAPSAFNCKSSRLVIVYGAEHDRFWAMLRAKLGDVGLPAEALKASLHKVDSRMSPGAGTVLFFEDWDVVTALQAQFPLYKESIPTYAQHKYAMAAYSVWPGLALADVGASLQHYTDFIEAEVKVAFRVPDSWKPIAQMPFGSVKESAGAPVQKLPDRDRVFVRGHLEPQKIHVSQKTKPVTLPFFLLSLTSTSTSTYVSHRPLH